MSSDRALAGRELTASTTRAILKFFFDSGIFAYRSNTVGIPIPGTGTFRPAAITGLPDTVAILPPRGRFLGVEIKTGKDKLRPEQVGALTNIRNMGGITIVAKTYYGFLLSFGELLADMPETVAHINAYKIKNHC